MILTGFADPDTEKFSSQPPPASKSAATLSVPPPAVLPADDESWKSLETQPESKR